MHAVKSEGLSEPVFIVTASYSAPALERQVMEAGASYFAIQPYNKAEMIDRILALTGASSHAAAAGTSRSDLRIQVTEILHQIGVPAHIKGYHYLRDSIIMAIEDEYEIEIPDEDAEKFSNIGDIVAFIEEKIAAK